VASDPNPTHRWKATSRELYDTIGVQYQSVRQADPRIAAQIARHVGDASSVLNIGAGSGSYEPQRRGVVAVEPSITMLAQRPAGAAPAIRAAAESLPFNDATFDVALGIFTLHHWLDPWAGLAEMARVAHRRILMTFEPAAHYSHWMVHDYFPLAEEAPGNLELDAVCRFLGDCIIETVMVPADCTDGFFGAYWRRPECYLDPAVRAGMSLFARLDDETLAPGLDRLARDLESGLWRRVHGDLLNLDALDVGIRLIVSG
jgi:SAM-dependent methyltransferase